MQPMKLIELKNIAKEVDLISFDIFDTLLVRLYEKPTDLFLHLERSFSALGFHSARISAENQARENAIKNKKNEVTLDEIYENIHYSYYFLKEKEIELEKMMCKANPEMMEFFQWCFSNNKRIVLSSDMYLPDYVIEEILSLAGYKGYDHLFLSSVTKRPKATGEMYEDIIEWSMLEPESILHIGDNRQTDYEIAKSKGLIAYLYLPIQETFSSFINDNYFSVIRKYSDDKVGASILGGMVTLRSVKEEEYDYWENFGFKYAGIQALYYVYWIKEQVKRDAIKKVFFMSRDGYIFKNVFDLISPEVPSQELWGSRSMYLLASMESYEEIKKHVTGEKTKGLTYKDCFKRILSAEGVLFQKYKAKFPLLNKEISEEDFSKIDLFFYEHENELKQVGREQRKKYFEYFQSIDLLSGKNAIVDLGWKGTTFKAIEKICEMEGYPVDLYGYYLATHPLEQKGTRVLGFAMNNGKPDKNLPIKALLDYGYTIHVMELIFSAPHPSILDVNMVNEKFSPTFQDTCSKERKRERISEKILNGVMDFVKEFNKINEYFPILPDAVTALIPIEYIATKISREDEEKLAEVSFFPGLNYDTKSYPIKKRRHSFGIINPWPGDQSAESEVLTRMRRAANENNIECVMLDNFGHILDNQQKTTKRYIDARSVDFIITTHYETPKLLDAFYYHTVWNPPEIPLNLDYYTDRVANQYLMNDDGSMYNHIRSMLMNKPRDLEGASMLTASFPMSAILQPKIKKEPKMFYCGMNWEKVVHNSNRHEGLFKLLDKTKKIKFYGPEKVEAWGGLRPWEGYSCYQHSIPFDGFSILNEINECGICLVLSSDIHRRAGAATNRTYEACAAGAVIISDENKFMLRHFKDAALFIDYNKENPEDTYKQIMEKYEWIITHPLEAQLLAEKAQKIFKEKFTLDVQLEKIFDNHFKRKKKNSEDLYCKDNSGVLLVTYVCNTLDIANAKIWIKKIYNNIDNQKYKNIILTVGVDPRICGEINNYVFEISGRIKVFPIQLFDKNGARCLTDGQVIRELQFKIPHDYFMNTSIEEIWFQDHVTSLIRTMEDEDSLSAYSGMSTEDLNGFRHVAFYQNFEPEHLYESRNTSGYLAAGQFIFSSKTHKYLPDFLFDCLDGKEHYAYANIICFKHEKKLSFSKRMSLVCMANVEKRNNYILDFSMQERFIKDTVRFHISRTPIQVSVGPKEERTREIAEFVELMPLKSWFKMRFYRWRMRRLNVKTTRYRRIKEKFDRTIQDYYKYYGGI